jgi:hypothetical protein
LIEDLEQKNDELRRVLYQLIDLDPKDHVTLLRIIQRAGAVL